MSDFSIAAEILRLAEIARVEPQDFQHVVFTPYLTFIQGGSNVTPQNIKLGTPRNLVLTKIEGQGELYAGSTSITSYIQRVNTLTFSDSVQSQPPTPRIWYEIDGETITNSNNTSYPLIWQPQILLFPEQSDSRMYVDSTSNGVYAGWWKTFWFRISGFYCSNRAFEGLKPFQTLFMTTPETDCIPDPNPIDPPLPPC